MFCASLGKQDSKLFMKKKKSTSQSSGNTWLHISGHCCCPLCSGHWRLSSCPRFLVLDGWKVGSCSCPACLALPMDGARALHKSPSEWWNSSVSLHCLFLPRWTKNFYLFYIIYILQMISSEVEPTLSVARLTQPSESSLINPTPWVSRGKFGSLRNVWKVSGV